MNPLACDKARSNSDVINAWLASAREVGVEDGYRGKRVAPRFTWSAPVMVEVLGTRRPGEAAYAYASDISAGGMGLRCRQPVGVFQRLRVTLDETGENLCGQVRHCTRTATGYLIGIEFEPATDEPAALRKSA